MEADREELIAIYKVHVELADRVSQRRAGANALYVSLITGLAALIPISMGLGTGALPFEALLMGAGIVGMLLSASWFIVLRSYRQLNTGKFKAIHELEQRLSYAFYTREWDMLERGNKIARYWRLTVVETFAPTIFFALFFLLSMGSLFLLCWK